MRLSFLCFGISAFCLISTHVVADQTPIAANPGAEPDLIPGLSGNPNGNVLDTLYGPGNYARVDDSLDQIWLNVGGSAEARAAFAGTATDLYYSSSSNPGIFVLRVSPYGYINGAWTALPGSSGENFSWMIHSDNGAQFSSVQTSNAGEDHMVAFQITGDTGVPGNRIGDYVICWEDLWFSGSDRDYNDVVIEVSGVAVPEPSTISLFVLATVAAVFSRGKRIGQDSTPCSVLCR
ncbi:MAG: DUF4114 domain-containing protein [Verrucomicrobiota bacterium]